MSPSSIPNTEEMIEVSGQHVQVRRKNIKNLHVGVYPPEGHVRVAAPLSISDDAIRLAVVTRLPWIKRQQRQFQNQERQSRRDYVSGETHYVFGRPLRLLVQAGGKKHRLVKSPQRLTLYSPEGSTREQRQNFLEAWYRRALRDRATPVIERWSSALGIDAPRWGIRKMKTKWGSCNPKKAQVWLNLELAKKQPRALDYVILHEIAHFISDRHDDRFVEVLDTMMPTWREVRRELNDMPLAHEPSFD